MKIRLRVLLGTAAALSAAFAGGALANSAAVWKVFATGQDSGEYYLSASASADAQKSRQLAVRALGVSGTVELSYSLSCRGERKVAAGAVLIADVANSQECTVYGYASYDGAGKLRVQLIRR